MLEAAECFHGLDAGAEQAALIRAFEFTLPAERGAQGLTLPELGGRLRDGAELPDGLPSTILTALSAFILLPYDEAVPHLRRALHAAQRPDAGGAAIEYVVVSVAVTTALWDAGARRALLDRAAAAARDAGALQVLDTTLWTMSLAELTGGTPRAAERHIGQVRELRRAIGYDVEQVVNAAYLAWSGASRSDVEAISDAALAMGFAGVHSAGTAALAVRDLAEGHYRDAYTQAQAVDRRAVPAGDSAGVRRLRRGRGAGRAHRGGAAVRARAWRRSPTPTGRPGPRGRPALPGVGRRRSRTALRGRDRHRSSPPTSPSSAVRTHLLYGEWLRRHKRRRDAREQLQAALASSNAARHPPSSSVRAPSWPPPG